MKAFKYGVACEAFGIDTVLVILHVFVGMWFPKYYNNSSACIRKSADPPYGVLMYSPRSRLFLTLRRSSLQTWKRRRVSLACSSCTYAVVHTTVSTCFRTGCIRYLISDARLCEVTLFVVLTGHFGMLSYLFFYTNLMGKISRNEISARYIVL
jgi:hypothetical protein